MPAPPSFAADPRLAEALRETPFPQSRLTERDGFRMQPIDTDRDPQIWKMSPNAIVEVHLRDDTVVRATVHEGRAGLDAWLRHGMRLPPERKAALEAALAEHPTVEAAVRATYGSSGARIITHLHRTEADGERHLYDIRQRGPTRGAVIEATIDRQGAIRASKVLEGRAAWDAYDRYPAPTESEEP